MKRAYFKTPQVALDFAIRADAVLKAPSIIDQVSGHNGEVGWVVIWG